MSESGGFMDKAKAAYKALAAEFGQADKIGAEGNGMEDRVAEYRAKLRAIQERAGKSNDGKSPDSHSMGDTLPYPTDRPTHSPLEMEKHKLLAEGKEDGISDVQAKIAAKQKEYDYLQRGAPEDVAWDGGMWAKDDPSARQNVTNATRPGVGSGDVHSDASGNCCCTAIELATRKSKCLLFTRSL